MAGDSLATPGTTGTFLASPMVERLRKSSRRGASGSLDAVRGAGSDVVLLNSGEPDFATPIHVTDGMVAALREGYTHYAPLRGDRDLIDAIRADIRHRRGYDYDSSEIMVTAGGRPGLLSAVLAIVGEGDKVLLPEPTYSIYADAATMAQAEPVFVASTPEMRLDIPALERSAEDAQLLILCNPCNPTGVVMSREELVEVARIASEHDLLVLVDEAYDQIVFDGVEFTSSLEVSGLVDRLVYCQTLSKTYAMTGWRCGYIAAPSSVISALAPIHQNFVGPVNTAVQRAAIVALTTPSDVIETYRQTYQRRRDLVVKAMSVDPRFSFPDPQGAFYLFFRYPHDISADDYCALALDHGVRLRPGTEFGPSGEGHARLAFSVNEAELTKGVARVLATASTLD